MSAYWKNKTKAEIGANLILDELFDLTLYRGMRVHAKEDFALLLDDLIETERRHLLFWEGCFGVTQLTLDFPRRFKLHLLLFIARIFGRNGAHLIIEAIEVFGIRKYLSLWKKYKDEELGTHIAGILRDELAHEDWIVSRYQSRTISPARVRSVFLGFNDGSVEILGVVSGFFVVFSSSESVLIAGATVAVAGAVSMAAGAYVASSSEIEIQAIDEDKNNFLGQTIEKDEVHNESALLLAIVVGVSYFVGAFIPILPVVLGATGPIPSILASGVAILCVSYVIAFLSGMNVRRRILMNLFFIFAAVSISSTIGYVVRNLWGIAV